MPLIHDGGRIVNISTGLTRMTYPGSSAYGSMKGAIEVLTRYLAAELGGRGIVVNTVAPEAIATDFSGGMVRDNPEVNKMVAGRTAPSASCYVDSKIMVQRHRNLTIESIQSGLRVASLFAC